MAGRTLLSPLSVSRSAFTTIPAPSDTSDQTNGNFTPNDGFTIFVVVNSDSAAHNLTVNFASGVDGQPVSSRVYPIAVTTNRQWLGPFPISFYGSQLQWNIDSTLVAVQPVSLFGP